MAEIAALFIVLEIGFDALSAYFLVKNTLHVAEDVSKGKVPKLQNVVGILMGVDILDPGLIPPDAMSDAAKELADKLSNTIVDHGDMEVSANFAATYYRLQEGGFFEALKVFIEQDPNFIELPPGFDIKQYLSQENIEILKDNLSKALKNVSESGINGFENVAFQTIITSLEGTDADVGPKEGDLFVLSMLQFTIACDDLFNKLDETKSGKLSSGEFKVWYDDYRNREMDSWDDRFQDYFSAFDTDGNSEIDKSEFMNWQIKEYFCQKKFVCCELCGHVYDRQVSNTHAGCHKSKDGMHHSRKAEKYKCLYHPDAESLKQIANITRCGICFECVTLGSSVYRCEEKGCSHIVCASCEETSGLKLPLPQISLDYHYSGALKHSIMMYEPDIQDSVKGIHRIVYVDPETKKKYFTGQYFKLYGDESIIRSKEGSVLIWRQNDSDHMHCRFHSAISNRKGTKYHVPGKIEKCQILPHDCEPGAFFQYNFDTNILSNGNPDKDDLILHQVETDEYNPDSIHLVTNNLRNSIGVHFLFFSTKSVTVSSYSSDLSLKKEVNLELPFRLELGRIEVVMNEGSLGLGSMWILAKSQDSEEYHLYRVHEEVVKDIHNFGSLSGDSRFSLTGTMYGCAVVVRTSSIDKVYWFEKKRDYDIDLSLDLPEKWKHDCPPVFHEGRLFLMSEWGLCAVMVSYGFFHDVLKFENILQGNNGIIIGKKHLPNLLKKESLCVVS